MSRHVSRRFGAVLLSILLHCGVAPAPATAQGATQAAPADTPPPADTREGELANKQAEKAKTLQPYKPSGAERWIDVAESLLVQPPRVYPFFGSVYPGGLLAVGAGVRQPLGDTALFDVHGAWSIRNFKLLDASYRLPALADRRIRTTLYGKWMDAPSVEFFGIGDGTSLDDRTTFLYRPTTAGARIEIKPVKVVALGGGVEYLGTKTDGGARGASADDRFQASQLPGFGEDLAFIRSYAHAALDWRDGPGYSRSGGLWRVDFSNYAAREGRSFSFRRLDADVRQYIPILRGNWVIVLGGEGSVTDTDAGDEVPFYLLPDLGGSGALPGYPSWRFRDRNRILVGGELRWTPGQYVDTALFYQAGKVTARRGDLDLDHLRDSFGIGVRFHTAQATVLRADLAKTKEGLGLVLAFSQGF
jgi:hypothetical protein